MITVDDLFNNAKKEYKHIKRKVKEQEKSKTNDETIKLNNQRNNLINNTKDKIDNYFRNNEIFAHEVQIMSKKSIRGDLFETINLFMACLTTLKDKTDNPEEINELWSFIPKLEEVHQKYIKEKNNSLDGRRPLYIIPFQKARYELIEVFSEYYTKIRSFINNVLDGTIIYTRRIRSNPNTVLSDAYVSDEIDSDNEEYEDDDEDEESESDDSESVIQDQESEYL